MNSLWIRKPRARLKIWDLILWWAIKVKHKSCFAWSHTNIPLILCGYQCDLILWWILLIYMFLLDQERTRLIEDSKEGRVALKATTNADWLKSMRRKIRPLLSDPYPVQYLGYCTMCNSSILSHRFNLMA